MNWGQVFQDIQDWMEESTKRHPITTDEYWAWIVVSLGELGNKHNNHPLVLGFLEVIIKFQEENYKREVEKSLK